jgi:hypothetical protein
MYQRTIIAKKLVLHVVKDQQFTVTSVHTILYAERSISDALGASEVALLWT